MRRLFGSVRARATLAATAVVAVALVAAGAVVLLSLRSNLAGQADTAADSAARDVAAQIAQGVPYRELDLDEDHPVQVVDRDGRVLAVSEDLEAVGGTGAPEVTPVPSPDAGRDDEDDPEIGEVGEVTWHGQGRATVDGASVAYRFAQVEVTDRSDRKVRVYAGASLQAQQDAVHTAATVMLVGLPVLLAVVARVTWTVTRRALRPVEAIRREMAAITASEDLARRVPVPDTHDEVARLARTTNETLAALETSVEQPASVRRRRLARAAQPDRLAAHPARSGRRAPRVAGPGRGGRGHGTAAAPRGGPAVAGPPGRAGAGRPARGSSWRHWPGNGPPGEPG